MLTSHLRTYHYLNDFLPNGCRDNEADLEVGKVQRSDIKGTHVWQRVMALSLAKRFLRPSNLRAVQILLSQRNFAEVASTAGLTFTFSTPTQVWYFSFLTTRVQILLWNIGKPVAKHSDTLWYWAIPEKKTKQGGWRHGIFRGIEERKCGNSKGVS